MDKPYPRQRQAFQLHYIDERKYDEICEIMHMNYHSVRNLVHRGMPAACRCPIRPGGHPAVRDAPPHGIHILHSYEVIVGDLPLSFSDYPRPQPWPWSHILHCILRRLLCLWVLASLWCCRSMALPADVVWHRQSVTFESSALRGGRSA